MKIIHINNEENLRKYAITRNGKEIIFPAFYDAVEDKKIKFVFDGTMSLENGMRIDIQNTIFGLIQNGFDVSVDVQLNSKVDRSTVFRSDLISVDVAYLIGNIQNAVSVNCVFEKTDGEVLSVSGGYFAWDNGHFLGNGEIGNLKSFIRKIKNDDYASIVLCESILEIEEQIDKIKEYDGRVKISVKLNKTEYNENFLRTVSSLIANAKAHGKEIDLVVDAAEMDISVDVVKILMENKEFNSYDGVAILYSGEYGDTYTGEELLSATAKVKIFIDEVKSSNASPFEKYLMIYRYVSQREYILNEETPGRTRDLISILNNNDIVCAGYASLLKYICNEVGIECEAQSLYADDMFGGESHANNRVYIKDEKYGIDGWYYVDATWDSGVNSRNEEFRYAYCLIPINDVRYMNSEFRLSSGDDSLGVFYKNLIEFMDVRGFTGSSYYINDKYVEKIGEKNHRTMTESEAQEKINEAVDVVERIMKRNSIGKYIFDVDNVGIVPSARGLGGVNKYVILYLSGSFSEEELERLMIASNIKFGKELKEKYEVDRESRQKSELRNHDMTTTGCINSQLEDIEEVEEIIERLKKADPNDPEIADGEEYIKNKKEWIESFKIKRAKEREELVASFADDCIDRKQVFKELKEFAMEKCLDWQTVNMIFEQARNQSKPVSADKFYKALVESYVAEGYSRNDAEKRAKADMERTKMDSTYIFGTGATNCFVSNGDDDGMSAKPTNTF